MAVALVGDAGAAGGYYWFALANAALYGGGSLIVVVLHHRENRGRSGLPRVRVHVGAAALALVLAGSACVSRSDDMIEGLTWTEGTGVAGPETTVGRSATQVDISTGTVNVGIYETSEDYAASNLVAIDHHFLDWNSAVALEVAALVQSDAELGRWPLVTVMPFPATDDGWDTILEDVAAGSYDGQIGEMCGGLATLDTPSFVRWGHEMELVSGRYPWASDDAASYIAAYRHFAERCRELMGDQLYLVWSPAGNQELTAYYPGDDVVDYVGLSVFDYAEYFERHEMPADPTFDELFSPRYERVVDYDKPVMIAEFGTTRSGSERIAWLNDAFSATPNYPLLRSIVFFHAVDQEGVWGDDVPTPDWRLEPDTLPNS